MALEAGQNSESSEKRTNPWDSINKIRGLSSCAYAALYPMLEKVAWEEHEGPHGNYQTRRLEFSGPHSTEYIVVQSDHGMTNFVSVFVTRNGHTMRVNLGGNAPSVNGFTVPMNLQRSAEEQELLEVLGAEIESVVSALEQYRDSGGVGVARETNGVREALKALRIFRA